MFSDVHPALAEAEPQVFWLDNPSAPTPAGPLTATEACDLLVIGGGLTGLWAAVRAKEREPELAVTLVEGQSVAHGASGRNGGFCAASLTHGARNGLEHFAVEISELQRLGRENLASIAETIDRYGIGCSYEPVGSLTVATRPHEVPGLAQEAELLRELGDEVVLLDRDETRAELNSPTYLGGLWETDTVALLDPARLAWGLRRVALELGVQLYEQAPVQRLAPDGAGLLAHTEAGAVRARHAVLATSAFPPLVRSIRCYVVPVYDYVLVTEPLSGPQLDALGWRRRQGASDSGNQFHYYRLTDDNRVLWGGYDAIYHYGNRIGPELEQRDETATILAENFFTTFPQLEGVRFTHRWGGAIDTCSRFCVTFGTALGGRVAYAVGFTGLGVGASRFGADVALDMLLDPDSPRLQLQLVRKRPLPFPPEPLRWIGIELTRRALARADRNGGRRGPWLRTLDRVGMGFDS
jgi:glycine/D-amino acid oxidase-like deaminating enzyme